MRIVEVPYDEYLEMGLLDLRNVRAFPGWIVRAAEWERGFLLILDDYTRRRATVFAYETRRERLHDLALISHLPEDGSPDAFIGARPHHGLPPRLSTAAKPLPVNDELPRLECS